MLEELDLENVDEEFVIFDLETTGLNPVTHRIIEIGAIRFNKTKYKNEGRVDTYQALVKQDKKLSKKIIEITGITDGDLTNGESIKDVLQSFSEFVGNTKVISYNADFDMSFLYEEARRSGLNIHFSKVECAYKLARARLGGVENYKLVTLAKILGLNTENAHRAIDDCLLTLKVYIALHMKKTSSESQVIYKVGKYIGSFFKNIFGVAS